MSETLLFTESEWAALCPQVTQDLAAYLRPYRTPVLEHHGDYGSGWGSGSYLQLGTRRVILTNEHVATVRRAGRELAHMFNDADNVYQIKGNHTDITWPSDLAILPISDDAWTQQAHTSRPIELSQFAAKHAPVPYELLSFVGFAGQRVRFGFGEISAEGTCYVAREVPLPAHDAIDPDCHFGIEFRPDLATDVMGTPGLPLPNGFSGSTVWNTGVVEARMNGHMWSPEMARVTGVVWGWPSGETCIVATRVEHVLAFLAEAAVQT